MIIEVEIHFVHV